MLSFQEQIAYIDFWIHINSALVSVGEVLSGSESDIDVEAVKEVIDKLLDRRIVLMRNAYEH